MSTVATEVFDNLPDPEDGLDHRAKQIISELAGDATAPFLFSEEAIDAAGARGGSHFTAGFLKRRNPGLYRAMVALSAAGYSLRDVADLLKVSKNTVSAAIDAEPDLLGTLKQRTAKALRRAGLKLAERIDRDVDKIPIGQAAVTLGIVFDKAQLAEGEATAIVEHRQSAKHADWADTLKAVEEAYADQGGETGLVGGEACQKGLGVGSGSTERIALSEGGDRADLAGDRIDANGATHDLECSVSAASNTDNPAGAAVSATPTPSDLTKTPPGGAGVETGAPSSTAH